MEPVELPMLFGVQNCLPIGDPLGYWLGMLNFLRSLNPRTKCVVCGTPASSPAQSQSAQAGAAANPVAERPRRKYYDLVTAEAEPGEELVYGDAATAVIVRWHEARDAFAAATDALDVLNARERRRLEIELIQEHELTLPPATRPWDWGDRRQEVRRRNALLDQTIVDRKMLRLRRFLTLGIWRK